MGKKSSAIGVITIAAVIAGAVVFVSSLGGGYKKPVNEMIDGMNKCDTGKIISAMIPEDTLKEEKKDSLLNWDKVLEKADDALETSKDLLEKKYGKNIKYSVKFLDKEKIKGDDFDDLEDKYDDKFDVEISKAYKVDTEMKVKGKKDEDTNEVSFYVVKVKGDGWKISTYSEDLGFSEVIDVLL